MGILGNLLRLATAAAILLTVSGCGDDLVVAGRDVLAVAAHDENQVTIHDLGGLAGRWNVTEAALRSVAKNIYLSPVWIQVGNRLNDVNEQTEGPARDVIIETACELVAGGDYSPGEVASKLTENAVNAGRPDIENLTSDATDVANDLSVSALNPQEKPAVALGCAINSTLSDLKAATG
jgi:hypothetical protein